MTAIAHPPIDQAARLRALVAGNGAAHLTHAAPPATAATPVAHCPAIAVASGKGGVGKTNICVNLAITFARSGLRTLLIDGDLGLGNADVLCGLNPRRHLGHCLDGVCGPAEILIDAPGGFRLLPGASGIARLADLDPARRANLIQSFDALQSGHDIILIDCGAGIGAGVLAFVEASDLTLVVATPEPTSVADAYALLKCLLLSRQERWGTSVTDAPSPSLALVVNQAKTTEEAIGVHQRIDSVTRRFLQSEIAFAGGVRADPAVSEAVRARSPLVLSQENCRAAMDIREMSGCVASMVGLGAVNGARQARSKGLLARALRILTPGADA